MKSGTNWLGGILNTHREISVAGEFHFENLVVGFNQTLNQNSIYGDVDGLRESTRVSCEKMIKSTILEADQAINGLNDQVKIVGDRTPHSIEPITLRGTPHIAIIRDGRDVLVSRAFHLFNNPQAHRLFQRLPAMAKTYEHFKADPWFFQKNPEELLCHEIMVRESGKFWSDHVGADRTVAQRYPNLPVCFVRYEDLHADLEGQRRRLFEFLEVDPEDCAPLEGSLKPGFEKERPDKFLRKGAIGDWHNYFTDDTTEWFTETAGEELERHGYV